MTMAVLFPTFTKIKAVLGSKTAALIHVYLHILGACSTVTISLFQKLPEGHHEPLE